MAFKKKTYIIVLIVLSVLALVSIPLIQYVNMIRVYYQFHTEIFPPVDSIYRVSQEKVLFKPTKFNETTRLFYLCKVWGMIKYYDNKIYTSSEKIDSLLIEAISQTKNIDNKYEFCAYLEKMIDSTQFTFDKTNPYSDIRDYALISNEWINDTTYLSPIICHKLNVLFSTHTGYYGQIYKGTSFIRNRMAVGNVEVKNEIKYQGFQNESIRLLGLFKYWNVINYFYPNKFSIVDDWDKILYKTIDSFRLAVTDKQYRLAIYKLTAKLDDSHTIYPQSIDSVVSGGYRPNFQMKYIDGKYIISGVKFQEFNHESFLEGDRILEINNKCIDKLADSLRNFIGGGNYWSKQRSLCNALLSAVDSVSTFTLIKGKDTIKINSINRTAYAQWQYKRTKEKDKEKDSIYYWINDSIAYLNLAIATNDNIIPNCEIVKKAKTIILDLRCYPYTDIMADVTALFVPPTKLFAYVVYPDVRFPGMLRYLPSSGEIGDDDCFKGNVFVLVDERTESFSEYLVMALQTNPKVKTIGTNSSGADGNVSMFEFPGGIKTMFTGVAILYPDFTPTQGGGVKIDYYVEPTIESIKNNIDVALEAAVRIAVNESYAK